MSTMSTSQGSRRGSKASWSSVAFIVESMLLLIILVASLAVLTKVFSSSLNQSIESRSLDAATIATTSIAEHFAADPPGVDEETQLGDLRILCTVTEQAREGGVLYKAHIAAYDTKDASGEGEPVYELHTARYVSEVQ